MSKQTQIQEDIIKGIEKYLDPAERYTLFQKRFIMFFDGNATESCRQSGYKGSDNALSVQGNANLSLPKIIKALQAREKDNTDTGIGTREDLQKWWTGVYTGQIKDKVPVVNAETDKVTMVEVEQKMSDRIKSSELLARSHALFVDTQKHIFDKPTDVAPTMTPTEAGQAYAELVKEGSV